MKASCFLALLLVVSVPPGAARAGGPEHLRTSWSSSDTATTRVLTWNSASLTDPSRVEYGTTSAYGLEAEGKAFQANGALGVIHEVELTGLEPGTTYHYRAGGPGAWSKDHTFTTGPATACDPFRFVALGDNRSDDDSGASPFWNPILSEALEVSPAFVLNTGDLVRDGAKDEQWLHFLESTGPGVATVPLMPSLGNHDDDKIEGDGASYNQLFSLPRNDVTGSEDYYFFTYGDAIFVAISMVTFSGGTSTFAEQAAWLDSVLTENPKTWKVVFFHHPIYTGGFLDDFLDVSHPPNELGQNGAFVPVFDEHHVDLVLNGHNHFYQRFEPMCCGGGGKNGVPTGDTDTGTTYIVTGGAGALTYDLSFLGLDLCTFIHDEPGSVACDGRHHFVQVEVDGLDLTARVFTTKAQLLSNEPGNAELIDEFTIHKSGPAPDCSAPEPEPVPEPAAAPDPEPAGADPAPDAGAAPEPDTGAAPEPDAAGGDTAEPSASPVPGDDGASEPAAGPSPEPAASDAAPWTPGPGTGSGDAAESAPGAGDVGESAGAGKKSKGGCGGGPDPRTLWPLLVLVFAIPRAAIDRG